MSVTTDYTRTAASLNVGVGVNPLTWISSQRSYDQMAVDTVERSLDGKRVVVTGEYRRGGIGSETWNLDDKVTLTVVEVPTSVQSVSRRAGLDIQVEVPVTYGPLFAFKGKAAAQRCLDGYADVRGGSQRVNGQEVHVVDGRVERLADVNSGETYWVALFVYDAPVAPVMA